MEFQFMDGLVIISLVFFGFNIHSLGLNSLKWSFNIEVKIRDSSQTFKNSVKNYII